MYSIDFMGFFLHYGSRTVSHFNMGPVNIYLERVDKLNCRVKTVLTDIKNKYFRVK